MREYIDDLDQIVDYCKCYNELDIEEACCMADFVVEHTFLFQSKWEMERTYKPVTFKKGQIEWDYIPFNDPEWTYAMNRNRYFLTLAQAYVFTGKEEYVKTFIRLIKHWITHNPCEPKYYGSTWRTIEAGLRCENWLKARELVYQSPYWDEEVEGLFRQSMEDHAHYIIGHNDDFRRLSNWGIIENHGLFVAGLYLEKDTYINVAKERLTKAVRLQVLEDGLHWEQSSLYHNEVLRALLDVAIAAKNNGIVLEDAYHEIVKKMVYAHLYMTKPNHIQLANGDSDHIDVRDLLVRGAYLYEEPAFKALAYEKVDFESIWDIGMKGVKVYDQLEAQVPNKPSHALAASGNYCMRDGWEEASTYVHFKCGSLGGGHGHLDMLHVDVAYLGEDILKDSGRYTYTDTKERYELKRAYAHNTTMVDGKPFTQLIDTWGYDKVAQPVQGSFITHPLYDYVEGAHLGYMDLEDSVYVSRKVLFIKPQIVVIADTFKAKGNHTYNQYFHFGKGELTVKKSQALFTGKQAKATLYSLSQVHMAKTSMLSSETYNHLEKLDVLTTEKENTGNTTLITVLVLEDQNNPMPHTLRCVPICTQGQTLEGNESISAFNITLPDETYTVVMRHDESLRRLMVVEGEDVFAKVALIHEKDGEKKVYPITY